MTTVTDGDNGANAFSADLSNEMDSVACDSDMKTAAAFNIYSQIAAFYGVEDVTALCQIRYTSKPTNASLTLETSGSGTGSKALTTTFQTISTKKWIRIHYNSGAAVSKRETLELEIKHATYGTIALSIAVVGVKGGAIYNLVPSANAITHKKDGTYTTNVITCGSSKLDVATGTTSSNPSEATIKYSADGGSVTNYPSGGLTAGTNFTNYVTFFLYVNNTVVDKETVNIVTDGDEGEEGKGYKLYLTRNGLYTDVQWDTWGAIGFNYSYSKATGDPDFLTCRIGDLFVVSGTSSDTGISHTATYRCTAVSSSSITGTCLSHVKDGLQGARGKAGRFYYFAGDWNSSASYVMTDTQAPYVKRGNSFYMLDNAGNGGTNVTSTNQDPSNASYGNGKPWTSMMSDMKYYIAQAFFGSYAHFGSAIINGDWMISQYGTLNGSENQGYSDFNPLLPTNYAYLCKNFNVTYSTANVGADFTLVAGKTYKFTCFAQYAGATLRVRLYYYNNNSYVSGAEVQLSNGSKGDFSYTVASGGSYCIRVGMMTSGTTGRVDINVSSADTWIPNYAVDMKTGIVYQNKTIMRSDFESDDGSIRSLSGGKIYSTYLISELQFVVGANTKNEVVQGGFSLYNYPSGPTLSLKVDSLNVTNGYTGTFKDKDGKTVTVQRGIITSVSS